MVTALLARLTSIAAVAPMMVLARTPPEEVGAPTQTQKPAPPAEIVPLLVMPPAKIEKMTKRPALAAEIAPVLVMPPVKVETGRRAIPVAAEIAPVLVMPP